MSLLDEARDKTAKRAEDARPRCAVSRLPDADREEIEEALSLVDGDTLTGEGIAAALAERAEDEDRKDLAIPAQTLNRHKRGGCGCETR